MKKIKSLEWPGSGALIPAHHAALRVIDLPASVSGVLGLKTAPPRPIAASAL